MIKKYDKPIAFVLGKYITGGLGVVRCLGRNQNPVLWLDSNPKQIGFFSKYCHGIICPSSKQNLQEYIDFLVKIGKNLCQKGVLLPIGDIEVYAILQHKNVLEQYYHIPISDLKITEKLLNKKIFYKTLEKLDIDHPKTYFTKDISEVKIISKKINYPCIIKPSYSAHFMVDFKTKLFLVKTSDELIKYFKKASLKKHEVVIQEIIPGGVKNMYGFNSYYDKESTPKCAFSYKRIREWPHGFGNGCFIESVAASEIEKITNNLIKKIGYHGIVDAEFKKDPRNNQFKLIEINPRCWMQNSLPVRYNINIPFMVYSDALGKKLDQEPAQKKQVKWLFIFEDIISAWQSIKKDELTFIEWIHSLKGKKEFAIFARDDPLPSLILFFKSFYLSIPFFLRTLAK
jgi:predicted ATP-grasp superfamily ATP-dependent carboligase